METRSSLFLHFAVFRVISLIMASLSFLEDQSHRCSIMVSMGGFHRSEFPQRLRSCEAPHSKIISLM